MTGTSHPPRPGRQIRLDQALSNASTARYNNGPAVPDNTADPADYLGLSDPNTSLGNFSMTVPFPPPPELSIQDIGDPEDPSTARGSASLLFLSTRKTPGRQFPENFDLNAQFGTGWVSNPQGSTNAQPWNAVAATESCAQGHRRQQPGRDPKELLSPQRRSIVYSEPDSGYYSYPGSSSHYAASVVSNPTSNFNQRIQNTRSIPRTIPSTEQPQVAEPQLRTATCQPNLPRSQNGAQAEEEDEMNTGASPISCDEQGCNWHGKTQADLKKHRSRHQLDHICQVPGCTRSKGFGTRNDLDRHKAGKHKIYPPDQRFWKCFAQGCSKVTRVWSRLDNFKQHILRIHKTESVENIVAQAEVWWNEEKLRPQPAVGQSTRTPTTPLNLSLGSQIPQPTIDQGIGDLEGPISSSADYPWNNYNMTSMTSMTGQSMPHLSQVQMPGTLDRDHVSSGYATASTIPNKTYNPMQSCVSPRGLGFLAPQNTTAQDGLFLPTGNPLAQRSNSYDPRIVSGAGSFRGFPHLPGSAASVYRPPNKILSTKNYAKTVADPRSTQQLLAELTPSYNTSPASSGPQLPHAPSHDIVTQAGSHPDLSELPSSSFSVPKITVDQVDGFDVNPQNIQEFLSTSARQTADGGILLTGSAFSRVLRSLDSVHSTPSKSSSNGTMKPSAEAEGFIEAVNEDGKNAFRCKAPECSERLWRQRSVIIKHVRRHTKPYGCTFDNCHKHFGSKNDWKRHEQKQHMQQECWRCEDAASPKRHDASCHKLHWTKQDYTNHLVRWHGITSSNDIKQRCRRWHINLHSQPQFWCGFCEDVLPLRNRTNFNNERFDHIAKHYIDEHRKIEDWLLSAGTKRKVQLQGAERPVDGKADNIDDESTTDAESEGDRVDMTVDMNPQPDLLSSQRPSQVALGKRRRARSSTSLSDRAGLSSTTPLDANERPQRRRRVEAAEYWTCCRCPLETDSFWSWATCASCMNCQHVRCPRCTPLPIRDLQFEETAHLQ